MSCELCGGGDEWIKTCLTPEGSRLLVCDGCYGEHASELTIVPGDWVVTARCGGCGLYGNPREFAEVRLGGRKGAYSGMCSACAEQIKGQVKGTSPVEGPLNPGLRPGTPTLYGI